ncbi:MAG: EndoU domain-containing protein [Arcicella sp.]|nr:EndoU domain-containing protein [Arcicella sp.]
MFSLSKIGSGISLISKLKNAPLKSILPAWKKVTIDIEHIASGHMAGGSRVSSIKSMFPEYMTKLQVEKAVRSAYKNVIEKLQTQDDRVLLRGISESGQKIEMWVNKATKTIETAYPVY